MFTGELGSSQELNALTAGLLKLVLLDPGKGESGQRPHPADRSLSEYVQHSPVAAHCTTWKSKFLISTTRSSNFFQTGDLGG